MAYVERKEGVYHRLSDVPRGRIPFDHSALMRNISHEQASQPLLVQEYAYQACIADPKSVKEALSRQDGKEWEEVIHKELSSIKKSDTYSLGPLPPGRRAVGCKFSPPEVQT